MTHMTRDAPPHAQRDEFGRTPFALLRFLGTTASDATRRFYDLFLYFYAHALRAPPLPRRDGE